MVEVIASCWGQEVNERYCPSLLEDGLNLGGWKVFLWEGIKGDCCVRESRAEKDGRSLNVIKEFGFSLF